MDAEVLQESIDVKSEIDNFIKNQGSDTPEDDFDYFAVIYEEHGGKYMSKSRY